MPWLEHPKYVPAREQLIKYLSSPRYRFRRLAPVLFLCGGAGSERRETLCAYLHKYRPAIRVFYAERVWEYLSAQDAGRSALEMEADLAMLADLVVIIVESPGTFAELGAFSLSTPLRAKLLPIVDRRYENQPSFIATGPLKWIDAESLFKPTIYAPHSMILEVADEIEERISRIPKASPVRLDDLAKSQKHLLFFLSDLVAVIYPATVEIVEHYITRIAPSIASGAVSIPTLLGLAAAMELLTSVNLTVGTSRMTFFFPGDRYDVEQPFHHRPFLDLPSQRAVHASVLLRVPEAKTVLENLGIAA